MFKQVLANLFNKKLAPSSQKAVRVLSPEEIVTQLNQAVQLHQSGAYEQAADIYENIIASDANNIDALHLLGLIKHLQNKNEEAITLLEKTLNINPSFTGAQVNLAVVLRSVLRYDESLLYFNKALLNEPNHLEALYNRGNLLLDMYQPAEALINFDQYLNNKKDNADVFSSKAISLQALERYKEALYFHDKSISLNGDIAKYYLRKGNVLRELQRYDEAINCYKKAQQLQPDYAAAHQNEGLTQLLIGNYSQGWPLYEGRWNAELSGIKFNFTQARWNGEQLENKKILLIAEQGFGDTIQFSRYIKKVADLGAIVYLFIPKQLLPLFKNAPHITNVFIEGEALPAFDYYYPLMSLALAFNTTLDSIPTPQFIFNISDITTDYWSEKVKHCKQPRVGIFWQSTTPQRVTDNKALDSMVKTNLTLRNILSIEFSSIFNDNLSFLSLQKEILPEDSEQLKNYKNVYELSNYIDDFADTAALIAQLDLVITIDTAVAHLAGTMGKPVWILLPFNADWRWLVNRNDSPWYPTARLFRQRVRGSLKEPLAEVSQALSEI